MNNCKKLQKTAEIVINDLEIMALHGVNEEEKVNKQPFSISLTIEPASKKGEDTDNISDTVSYSAVTKLVKKVVEGNSFNLLEKLSKEILTEICKNFDIQKATVLVEKLDPPMSVKPRSVGYRKSIDYALVYLSLGSSLGDKNKMLDFAVELLKKHPLIRNVRESKRIKTAPYGDVAENMFLNSAVELETALTPEELLEYIHEIEKKAGRVRKVRWEDRELDIDIGLYGEEIINTKDLVIPHKELHKRLFFLEPILELNDSLFHPVLHRYLQDLFNDITPLLII